MHLTVEISFSTVCVITYDCRYLKSEMHDAQYMLRFAVILEAYLKGCGEAMLVGRHDLVLSQSDSNTPYSDC